MNKNRVVCIMGPTAVGKTALAMDLYDALSEGNISEQARISGVRSHQESKAEIISVDSALVYRGMDIGTAKPSAAELENYPHHLIDICDPAQPYSAANFSADASTLIQKIHQKGKTVILVGGTMLYYRALLEGFHVLPAADEAVRKKLLSEANEKGWGHLHHRLKAIDAVAAKRIHPNDTQRIQRALEVFEISGQTLTELQQQTLRVQNNWQLISLAVAAESREILRQTIAERFYQMLEQGFEKEVQGLIERGDLHTALPAIRAVGYRQMWDYLHGRMDREQMILKAITATRQLAKRQMTWLRSWPDIHWLKGNDAKIRARTLLSSLY